MIQHRGWLLGSLGSWGVALALCLGLSACSAKPGEARCNPDVDVCDSTGDMSTTATTTGQGGTGGAGGAATSTTSSTSMTSTTSSSGMGGATTGTGGRAGLGGSGGVMSDGGRPFSKRIVAYLPVWAGSLRLWASDMPWLRVTHVMLAFATPTGSTFTVTMPPATPGTGQDTYMAGFVTAAHAAGVKVSMSIGGANGSRQIQSQYTPANVDAFVNNIAAYIDAQNLDGIDVDLEGSVVNGDYGPFVDKLVAKLRPKGKLVTAALAQWFANNIQPGTMGAFDFISVMSYDHCAGSPCNHATYESAVSELNFFKTKGATADKLLLGVPFYCHCWGPGCPMAMEQVAYAQVLVKFPGGMDYIQSAGTTYSCNGPATIRQKATLAKGYGGMMAWELTQDAGGDQSLLKVVADSL